jgi:hypothetical protein
MASVSSDVTVRDVGLLPGGEREEGSNVRDLLIYTTNSPSLLLVIHWNKSLKAFNVDPWRCVSRCNLDSPPVCMYELSGGSVFIHCVDHGLYRVTSMSPLAVTRHGQTGERYWDIAVLDDTRLIAVSPYSPPGLHVLGHRGALIADLTKTWDSYGVGAPGRITCHAGRVIVLDREDPPRVVCMHVSPDNHVTHEWTSEDLGRPRDVLITAGVLLVTCNHPAPTVISLDMESGRVLERVALTQGTSLYHGLCLDEATSRMYAGLLGGRVAELHLQGKL